MNLKYYYETSVVKFSKERNVSVLVEECRELLPNGSVTISGVDDGKEEGIEVDVDEVVDNPEYKHRLH